MGETFLEVGYTLNIAVATMEQTICHFVRWVFSIIIVLRGFLGLVGSGLFLHKTEMLSTIR
jgi:hypothetical protein